MDKTTKTLEHNNNYSDGSELIPAEVAAKKRREGSEPPNEPVTDNQEQQSTGNPTSTEGYTVDQEGLVNNYAVTPKLQEAKYPTPKEQFNYLIWGGIAAAFVITLIFIAFNVS
ncbi:MAG: ssl1498 family light-harvesting-like protein [Cyanobacteria bacterium P01_G01_bin.49]